MKIFLRFEMVGVSRAVSSSRRVCHTEGKGKAIRWTMGTPVGGRGNGKCKGKGGICSHVSSHISTFNSVTMTCWTRFELHKNSTIVRLTACTLHCIKYNMVCIIFPWLYCSIMLRTSRSMRYASVSMNCSQFDAQYTWKDNLTFMPYIGRQYLCVWVHNT